MRWRKALDLIDPHFVASTDDCLFPKFAHVSREVVDERVAIIQNENHRLLLSQHLAEMRLQERRLVRFRLEGDIPVGANEEETAIAGSVASGKRG